MPNNQSSSLHAGNKVASCDDLVTAILLPLPVRTLLWFKSVSKHWYSLITSPSFKRPNPDSPSGLFVAKKYASQGYEFVPFDIVDQVKLKPNFKPLSSRVRIWHSCNGLIVCSDVNSEFTITFNVDNPTTNQFTRILNPESYSGSAGLNMTLAFDAIKSPHYRVVYVYHHLGPKVGYNCRIDIYSSETKTFKASYKLSLDNPDNINFVTCVYWNNTLHWLNYSGFVSYFNLDEEGGTNQIQTPFGVRSLNYDCYYYSGYIFESRDHLYLVEINRHHTLEFKIHELKRDYSEWFEKYHIDPDQLGRSFPEIIDRDSNVRFNFDALSLVLGEIEDDSFLVFKTPDEVMRCNLVSKTFYKLHLFTSSRPFGYDFKSPWLPRWPCYYYQFMESLYSV